MVLKNIRHFTKYVVDYEEKLIEMVTSETCKNMIVKASKNLKEIPHSGQKSQEVE